jgi:transposase InsO family protein
MRLAGLRGVTRAKTVKTTRPDPAAVRHPDLVKRDFTATGPNQLWVTDLNYVPTWAGVGYVCFITDVYSRMIVGWRVACHMRTDMILDAIEMPAGTGACTTPDSAATATQARSSPLSATANGSPRSAPPRRSAPSATRMTTRSLRA